MGKRIWLIFVILVMTLSAGCDLNLTGATQAAPAGPSLDELSTLAAAFTPTVSTPALDIPDLSSFTSTPVLDLPSQGGELPSETATLKPTKTTMPGEIKITSITQKSPGIAIVKWEATGNFPSGFKIVFSDQQEYPTYPENTYASIYSSSARAGVINYTADRIYYVRVCRFMVDHCDAYSDLGIFEFAPPTATPRPTKTPSTVIINGTSVAYDPSLRIIMMKSNTNGKAYIEWKDTTNNTKPYRIYYSSTTKVPTLGSDPYFAIDDPKARTAFVDGASGAAYNYRICRFSGGKCTSYSQVYSFSFGAYTSSDSSSINISSIINTGIGISRVSWKASGSFPNGFKILYSKTNSSPTEADSVTVVNDGSARSGYITGDPSGSYYVRVCKVTGSNCSVYSPVLTYSFAADSSSIYMYSVVDNDSTAGSIDIQWFAFGSFPDGYILLYSSDATPVYSNSSRITVTDESAYSATLPASANSKYYLRVCKTVGTTCGVYSDIVEFTTATSDMVLTADGVTPDKYNWTLPSDTSNPDGYHLMWIEGETITPADDTGFDGYEAAVAADRSLTLSSPLGPGDYILRLCTWNATDSKCMAYSNTLLVSE